MNVEFVYLVLLLDKNNKDAMIVESIHASRELAEKRKEGLDKEPYEGPLYLEIERRILFRS